MKLIAIGILEPVGESIDCPELGFFDLGTMIGEVVHAQRIGEQAVGLVSPSMIGSSDGGVFGSI